MATGYGTLARDCHIGAPRFVLVLIQGDRSLHMHASFPDCLRKAAYVSAAAFLPFLALNLLNTAVVVFGPETCDRFQRVARGRYQEPRIEIFGIVLPIVVHVTAALLRAGLSPARTAKLPRYALLRRVSG